MTVIQATGNGKALVIFLGKLSLFWFRNFLIFVYPKHESQ